MTAIVEPDLRSVILAGAKAAREIGKSRERTFAIGDGLLALRAQCLTAMGKDPRINDRTILKSGKYRELMGKALKTYPDYTLDTVFKNDSTRLAYMWCAENKPQIENVFAQEEIKNPGSTLRICNPERMKSKFKSLTDPPKKKKAEKEKQAEIDAQEKDEQFKKLRDDAINSRRQYDELFAKYVDFDNTPPEKLADMLFDTAADAKHRKNRLAFIDLVVKYAGEPKSKKERKPKAPKAPKETVDNQETVN